MAHECRCVTREELEEVMRATVRQTLTEIGMDAAQPLELQRDMSFLRDLRQATSAAKSKAIVASIGVLVTAALGALALGVRNWLAQ